MRVYLVLLSLLVLTSCNRLLNPTSFESKADYLEFMQNKEEKYIKKVNLQQNVVVEAAVIPNDFIADKPEEQELIKDNLYLLLSFSKDGKELLSQFSSGEYGVMVQTFSFGMEDRIRALINDQEIVPIASIFQPTYQMTDSNDIIVVFKRDEILGGNEIDLHVKEFGLGSGDLTFSFTQDEVSYLSNIKISTP